MEAAQKGSLGPLRLGDSLQVLRRRRRGIEVILAEVILIAITVTAGVVLVGYAFGLFGTLTRVAEVSPDSARCFSTNSTCVVLFSDPGSVPASALSCSISGTQGNILEPIPSVPAGGEISLSCEAAGLNATPGAIVYGRFIFSSGAPVSFVGLWETPT